LNEFPTYTILKKWIPITILFVYSIFRSCGKLKTLPAKQIIKTKTMNKEKLENINQNLQINNPLVTLDGITDYNEFSKVSPKILWILKEVNQNGTPHADDLRNFLPDVRRYPKWKRTYKVMMQATYAILNNCTYAEIPPVDQIYDILRKVAVINIKKIGGNSNSNHTIIKKTYSKNRSIILDQIESISPDIIINGSRVWSLFQDLPGNDGESVENFNVKYMDEKTYIHAYHTCQTKIKQEKYVELIRRCVFRY
jgi:hypothetical protein